MVRAFGRATPAWAGAEWFEAQEGPFTLHYRREDEIFASRMLLELNSRLGQLSQEWGFIVPEHIPVRIHPSYESLNRAIGWEGQGLTLGAYVMGRLELVSPAVWSEHLPFDSAWARYVDEGPIVHELAHLLLDYAADGNYPVWFSEGFAQYWEYRLVGYIWSEPGYQVGEDLFPIEQLQRRFHDCLPEYVAYRQALGLVELMYREHGAGTVSGLVGHLAEREPFEHALRKALGLGLSELDARWRISIGATIGE